MTEYVVPLIDARDLKLVGGKAYGLARLVRAGLRIPRAFVVTVDAHREGLLALQSLDTLESDIPRDQIASSFSQEIVAQVHEVFRTLNKPLAVRSSALNEDGKTAAYAGLFRTHLNLTTLEAVLAGIWDCWQGARADHLAVYDCERNGETISHHVAVLLQEMVESNLSGVTFSVDPVSAKPGVATVEWTVGFGNRLVSNGELVGRAYLDRKDRRPLHIDVIRDERAPSPDLFDDLLTALDQAEGVLGCWQDMEWAWDGETLFILQSRPMTVEREHPGPREPFPWELAGRPRGGWTERQRDLFGLWDEYDPAPVEPLHYCLYKEAIWQGVLEMLAGGTDAGRIEEHVLLAEHVPIQVDPAGRVLRHERVAEHARLSGDLASELGDYVGWVKTKENIVVADLDFDRLFALTEEVAWRYRSIAVYRLMRMREWIDTLEEACNAIRTLLKGLRDVDMDSALDHLLEGVDHVTRRRNQAFGDLSRQIRELGWTPRVEGEFEAFLGAYGHFEIGGTLSCEEPALLRRQLESCAVEGNPHSRSSREVKVLIGDLCARLDDQQDRERLAAEVQRLRDSVRLREDSKTEQNKGLALLRCKLIPEIGARLVGRQVTKSPQDVSLMRPEEILWAWKTGRADAVTLRNRKALIEWKRGQSWLPNGFLGSRYDAEARVFRGVGASPGIYEGHAVLVPDIESFGNIVPGSVVVCRATNPTWTQIFSSIGAIVVENGSKLSHAAITAREFGLPAVVDVQGALQTLEDGEMLRVDGYRGEVTRIDKTC